MDVEIRVAESGDFGREFAALYDWLLKEPEFRGHVKVIRAAPGPDEMGSLPEVLMVALGAGGAGTVLANTLSVWIKSRRTSVRLMVKCGKAREVELEAEGIEDAVALLTQVLREADLD